MSTCVPGSLRHHLSSLGIWKWGGGWFPAGETGSPGVTQPFADGNPMRHRPLVTPALQLRVGSQERDGLGWGQPPSDDRPQRVKKTPCEVPPATLIIPRLSHSLYPDKFCCSSQPLLPHVTVSKLSSPPPRHHTWEGGPSAIKNLAHVNINPSLFTLVDRLISHPQIEST